MFVLYEMVHTVRVQPTKLAMPLDEAVLAELNAKLANKVVLDVGLCMAVLDVLELGDSYVIPGDAGSHTKTKFSAIVFRPFVDEVLVGKIKSSDSSGITVTLGFFDDVFIPATAMPHPSRFDEKEQRWVWEVEAEEGKNELAMDVDDDIRFRVVSETFTDTSPTGPVGTAGGQAAEGDVEDGGKRCPYLLMGSINESGLGLLCWW